MAVPRPATIVDVPADRSSAAIRMAGAELNTGSRFQRRDQVIEPQRPVGIAEAHE